MNEPFVFRKVFYLVEATGYRAKNLDQMLRVVTVVDPVCINYHLHHEYLAWRAIEQEWPNDFAYWTARILGDYVLAEKFAALRVFNYRSLEALQFDVARILAHHMESMPAAASEVAPAGRDFTFCMARSIVTDCGRTARTLSDLERHLSEVEASSLYFHLFETRFFDAEGRTNDFALWVKESLRMPGLAEKIAAFDPYMFSLEGARKAILRIVGSAQEKSS